MRKARSRAPPALPMSFTGVASAGRRLMPRKRLSPGRRCVFDGLLCRAKAQDVGNRQRTARGRPVNPVNREFLDRNFDSILEDRPGLTQWKQALAISEITAATLAGYARRKRNR